jgi:hypothetical protein
MVIDCARCPARGPGCPDCVIGLFLERRPLPVELDAAERRALRQLARAGLVRAPHPMSDSDGSAGCSVG